jgi:hypothetical protein
LAAWSETLGQLVPKDADAYNKRGIAYGGRGDLDTVDVALRQSCGSRQGNKELTLVQKSAGRI